MRFTFSDGIEHVIRYLGSGPSEQVLADIKQSVDTALRELHQAHNWTYYYKHGRILTEGPYTTGTVAITASTREADLTGGSWPTWAADGYLRIGAVIYRAATRLDVSRLILDPVLTPGSDIVSTPFSLYKDSYLLPLDFIAGDQALYESVFSGITYVHPREWLFAERYRYQVGIPRCFTITGDERYPGRLLIRFSPIPGGSRTVDFIYKRKARDLVVSDYSTGTVAVAGSGVSVVGTGTAFTASMVGSVLRISSVSRRPTASPGLNPAVHESVITAVADATNLTIQDASPATYGGVGYLISDPVDIENNSMLTAFLRGCENQIGMTRKTKDKPDARAQYVNALLTAKEHDSRSFARRAPGDSGAYRQRMKDMPIDLSAMLG